MASLRNLGWNDVPADYAAKRGDKSFLIKDVQDRTFERLVTPAVLSTVAHSQHPLLRVFARTHRPHGATTEPAAQEK